MARKAVKNVNVIVRDPNRHARERHRRLYGVQDMVFNEDLAHPLARKEWPRYIVLPDGRQGPLAFQNEAEKREYYRRYDFAEG